MTTTDRPASAVADWLLSPEAIRAQCGAIYSRAESGDLTHFALHPERIEPCADEVLMTIRASYPDLRIPPHARWRHFVLDGRDRWAEIASGLEVSARERARLECELAFISVLLDAGAGASWCYRDPDDGTSFARSEGLALASLKTFAAGDFGTGKDIGSTVPGLTGFTAAKLARGFQVRPDNPLDGVEGRSALIAALGDAVAARRDVFGDPPRLGHIADHFFARGGDRLPAREILRTVLDVLGPVWPAGATLAGQPLGDCWAHPEAPEPGLVPFHKLSQWLTYSLIEPLERAGLRVEGRAALTGLAEYRNGGLFIDSGVLALKEPGAAAAPLAPGDPLVVEWRALTVILLDKVAEILRAKLALSADELPLAAVLEGGTWATGRRLARAKRPGGGPPLTIQSTGTVF